MYQHRVFFVGWSTMVINSSIKSRLVRSFVTIPCFVFIFWCLFSLYSHCSLWIHVNMKLEVQSHQKIVFSPKKNEGTRNQSFVCLFRFKWNACEIVDWKKAKTFVPSNRNEMYSNIGRRPFASDRNVNFTHIINMLVNLFWWFVSWALNCSNIR